MTAKPKKPVALFNRALQVFNLFKRLSPEEREQFLKAAKKLNA